MLLNIIGPSDWNPPSYSNWI